MYENDINFTKNKKKYMNNLYKLIIFVGVLLFSSSVKAQSNKDDNYKSYSLDECIKMALEHNYNLANARKDLKMAHSKKRELETKYFPTVSANLMAYQSNHPFFDRELDISTLSSPLTLFKKGYLSSVAAIEPVFSGKRIVVGNKIAKIGEESNILKVIISEKEIKENTEVYFWKIINLKEKRKTLEAQAELLMQLHHDVALAVKVGVTNRNDLLRVELQEQRIESGFVTVDHGIALSKLALMQYMGIMNKAESFEVDNQLFDINSQSFPDIIDPISYRTSVYDAVRLREEFDLLNKKVVASKLEKRLELGKYLPQIAIGVSFTQFNILDGINEDLKIVGKSLNLASLMESNSSTTQRVGFVFGTLKIPISSWWGGSHALTQKKLAIEKANNDLKNGEELMQLEIIKTWNALTEAYDHIKIARKAIISSKENLRLNRDTYSVGTTIMADLLDAQMLVQESENQLTEAKTKYMIAWAKYRRITME